MDIGKALKRVRFEKGMRANVVAKKAKISVTYLSLLENGKKDNPSPTILRKLMKIYNVPHIVLSWYSIDDSDIESKKLPLYRDLKPILDELMQEIIK
jgi:transcriptional regulator with XRE-family HTH domain